MYLAKYIASIFTVLFLVNVSGAIKQTNYQPIQSISITAGIYAQAYDDYQSYLEGDTCQNLSFNKKNQQIQRVLIDLKIACLAFNQQSIKLNIDVIPFPNNERAISMVEQGKLDTLVSTVWSVDVNEDYLYATRDVIERRTYEKGIYVLDNHKLLTIDAKKLALNRFTGLTVNSWHQDKRVLKKLTPEIIETKHFPALFLMLKEKRADFLLSSFPTRQRLEFNYDEIIIRPISGIKVVLDDSRRFVISKNTEKGQKYYTMLNRGLDLMQKKGQIKSIYKELGFYNSATKDWQVIN